MSRKIFVKLSILLVAILVGGVAAAWADNETAPGSGSGRRGGSAGNPALRGRGVQVHGAAGEGQPAGEGFLNRDDRRGPRDDCRGGFVRREPEAVGCKSRAAGQTCGPAHDSNERRGSGEDRGAGGS